MEGNLYVGWLLRHFKQRGELLEENNAGRERQRCECEDQKSIDYDTSVSDRFLVNSSNNLLDRMCR